MLAELLARSLYFFLITNILIHPRLCTSKAAQRFDEGEDHFCQHGGEAHITAGEKSFQDTMYTLLLLKLTYFFSSVIFKKLDLFQRLRWKLMIKAVLNQSGLDLQSVNIKT